MAGLTESTDSTLSRWVLRNDTRLRRVIPVLREQYGEPEPPPKRDGLQVLVLTVLSQNTTDPKALEAYENLLNTFLGPAIEENRDRLPTNEDGSIDAVAIRMSQAADALPNPDWEALRTAPVGRLEECISVCGLQQAKSATIQRVLDWVHDQVETYDLDELVDGNRPEEAARRLSDIKGVGVKTAAVTLIEAYHVDLCPVDTHVHRIVQRLRLVKPTSNRDTTYRRLQPLLPEGEGYAFHHNLLTFGRTVCTARDPDCEDCVFNRVCYHYRVEQQDEDRVLRFVEE